MRLAMVCVAGGSGVRFGGDKLAEQLGGTTVLEASVAALLAADADAPLAVVVPEARRDAWMKVFGTAPRVRVVSGGARRQDSVRLGVEAVLDGEPQAVAIHDGARPLVHPEDVHGAVLALGDAAGTILCGRAVDTVKRVGSDGFVRETIDRRQLRMAQTPQVFRISALLRAWQEVPAETEWTDEAAMLESLGMPVRSVVAHHPNPKLTTADDLRLIRALWSHG
jgi:2-C-methyl-D-erythritol 4-phosphate cytidylyltransferase